MTSNHPTFFKASSIPKFPFDVSNNDDHSGDQECPQCSRPLNDHTNREHLVCARKRLKGEKG